MHQTTAAGDNHIRERQVIQPGARAHVHQVARGPQQALRDPHRRGRGVRHAARRARFAHHGHHRRRHPSTHVPQRARDGHRTVAQRQVATGTDGENGPPTPVVRIRRLQNHIHPAQLKRGPGRRPGTGPKPRVETQVLGFRRVPQDRPHPAGCRLNRPTAAPSEWRCWKGIGRRRLRESAYRPGNRADAPPARSPIASESSSPCRRPRRPEPFATFPEPRGRFVEREGEEGSRSARLIEEFAATEVGSPGASTEPEPDEPELVGGNAAVVVSRGIWTIGIGSSGPFGPVFATTEPVPEDGNAGFLSVFEEPPGLDSLGEDAFSEAIRKGAGGASPGTGSSPESDSMRPGPAASIELGRSWTRSAGGSGGGGEPRRIRGESSNRRARSPRAGRKLGALAGSGSGAGIGPGIDRPGRRSPIRHRTPRRTRRSDLGG